MATDMRRTSGQIAAFTLGAVYLLIGIVGFFITGFDRFASNTDEAFLIFELNPLHNVLHIVPGVVWLAAARTARMAAAANLFLGATFAGLFFLGLFDAASWLSIDGPVAPDNWLHLATAAAGLYFGSIGANRARVATT